MKKLFPALLALVLFSCTKVFHVSEVNDNSYSIESSNGLDENKEITELIKPYKEQLDKEMNQVIGHSAITMYKARPQSTLGNWMADAQYIQSQKLYTDKIDFAVQNYGGIRIPEMRKGDITRGKIYELMPFENRLVILKIKGTVVEEFFQHMAAGNGWPISKHVRFEIKDRVAFNILINDEPIDPDKTYKIALADYIANGGDKCSFFVKQPRDNLNVLIRDQLIEFVINETAQGRPLDAEIDRRVIALDK